MHEISIMKETLDLAIATAQAHSAQRIDHLTLKIGLLSGVVPEALRFAFDVVVQGTIAEGATLEIELIPIQCHCTPCNQPFEPEDDYLYECPSCHQFSHRVLRGRELQLASLEVS
ncbi:MAG: hydrogenase maturation nickel metallochaperone HypA [Prochlorotrichaceae cyanobacterium]